MTQIEWKISNKEATIDSDRSGRGVNYEDALLFGVCRPAFGEPTLKAILEQFKQEDRLTVRYAGTSAWPVWTELQWQIFETRDRPGLNIDLHVSVRTDQPSCDPELFVQSFVPRSECFIVKGPGSELIQLASDKPHLLTRLNSTGCLLLRPEGRAWSLVEMVHPVDFAKETVHPVGLAGNALKCHPEHPGFTHLQHHLFTQSLEKGVLLRARLRAIIIDRVDDLKTAATLYAEFTDEPPVL